MRLSVLLAVLLFLVTPLAGARRIKSESVQRHSNSGNPKDDEDEFHDDDVDSEPDTGDITPDDKKDSEVSTAVSTAVFIIKKIAQSATAYAKFKNMKTVLDETKVAIALAEESAKELAHNIPDTMQLVATSGLHTLIKKLNDGTAKIKDLELHIGDDAVGAQTADKMVEAVEGIEELSKQIFTIMTSIDGVSEVLEGAMELFVAANEVAGSVVKYDIQTVIDPVQKTIDTAKKSIDKVYTKIDGSASQVMTLLQSLTGGTADKGAEEAMKIYEKLKAKSPKLFDQFQQLMPELELMYETVIKPLLPKLEKAVESVSDQVAKLMPAVDRPDSVATEVVGRSSCAWKNARRLESIENVDVGKTMACKTDKAWHGRYICWCVGKKDCYVKSAKRPDGEKGVRRCFKVE